MPSPGEKKCIDNVEYVWTPASAAQQSDISSKLTDIIDLLNVIAANMSVSTGGSTVGGYGGYRSLETDVEPRKNDWEISLGFDARNLNIRTDQAIKIKLGSTGGDLIKVDPTESPFEILGMGQPVSVVYVTTGRDTNIDTNVRILAY